MDIENIKLYFDIPEMSVKTIATLIASGAMVFGGVVPYIPQYSEIKRTGNADGFSTFVCLNLLVANTLRILFWFGRHFELPLLAQSIVMIIAMLAMVHICTVVKTRSELIPTKTHSFFDSRQQQSDDNLIEQSHHLPSVRRSRFSDFDSQYFWRWSDYSSYLQFLLLFTVVASLVTWLLIDFPIYVETLGFAAVFAEAMLGAPQFYRNYENRSTKGMSVKMVLCWMCGDVFKTVYFFIRKAPAQFWICGLLQVSIDIAILSQVYFYNPVTHIHVQIKGTKGTKE